MRISDWSSDVCSSDLEGDRYKFGDVTVQSDIRDLQPDTLRRLVPMKKGDWYNAKQVEDTVTSMTETAGLFGYAFAEINPEFRRNKDDLTMGLTFQVEVGPRVQSAEGRVGEGCVKPCKSRLAPED